MISAKNIRIIHRHRKTVKFEAADKDKLLVTAPHGFSHQDAMEVIKKNEDRIQALLDEYASRRMEKTLRDGSTILFHGEKLVIRLIEDPPFAWRLEDELLIDSGLCEHIKEVLRCFYKTQAQYLIQRAYELAEYHAFPVNKISTRWNKSRWGSCSSSGNVSLAIALVMTPLDVIDYVIIHELCHLEYPDHSRAFWQKVEHYVPDYKRHLAWLKEHSYLTRVME